MNIRQAIEIRESRRTFDAGKLGDVILSKIQTLIHAINEESGLTFSLVEDGSDGFDGVKSYGMFKNVRTILILKGKKGTAHLNEIVGYYGEKLVLEITSLGLGSCWVAGSYKKVEEWCQQGEEIVCVVPIGMVTDKKDIKEKVLHRASHIKRKSLEDLCSFDKPETWFVEAMKAVQQAPSAMNAQPVFFSLKNGVISVQLTKENKYAEIDLGIAKYHFEAISGVRIPVGNLAMINKGD